MPGCSGSRNLRDNLADLNAQIAANQKGISLLEELINAYSLPVVQAYMGHIQENAEIAVRQLLCNVGKKTERENGTSTLKATDFMDDGTKICLQVHIDTETVGKFNMHFLVLVFRVMRFLILKARDYKSIRVVILRRQLGEKIAKFF